MLMLKFEVDWSLKFEVEVEKEVWSMKLEVWRWNLQFEIELSQAKVEGEVEVLGCLKLKVLKLKLIKFEVTGLSFKLILKLKFQVVWSWSSGWSLRGNFKMTF